MDFFEQAFKSIESIEDTRLRSILNVYRYDLEKITNDNSISAELKRKKLHLLSEEVNEKITQHGVDSQE